MLQLQQIQVLLILRQMYKLVINADSLKEIVKTPLRIVQFQTKQFQKQQPISGDDSKNNQILQICETRGQVLVYKHYKRQVNNLNEQSNMSCLSNRLEMKSQILFINKISKIAYLNILKSVEQREEHIQLIQLIEYNQTDKLSMNVIIYFKDTLISQQFYHLLIETLNIFALYIKQVIVMSRPIHQELYKEIVFIVNQFKPQQDQPEPIYKQLFIQLPTCLPCLNRLQFDISGLPQCIINNKALISSQSPCPTCLTVLKNNNNHIKCSHCETIQDIWICMVCSDIGCGRYKNADAFKHFQATGHIITMDLTTQRIWNYISDNFSHRIIPLYKQDITLKFPDYNTKKNNSIYQQSLEGAFWQYCSSVSEELQRQRLFYEKQKAEQQDTYQKEKILTEKHLLEIEKQIDKKSMQVKKLSKKNKKLQKRLSEIKQKCSQDRQLLNGIQRYLKEDHRMYSLEQIQKDSSKIQEKLKIISDLEKQIQNTLLKLGQ